MDGEAVLPGVSESIELGLTEAGYFARFDLDDLLRMDSAGRYETWNKAVGGGWM